MKIVLKATDKTPAVNFNEGVIELKGRSILEDSAPFYRPLVEWLEHYVKSPPPYTQVNFKIEYSNSNSNKFIFKMINLLEKCYLDGHDIKINWYYETDDDSVRDLGMDFMTLTKVPFNLVEVNQ